MKKLIASLLVCCFAQGVLSQTTMNINKTDGSILEIPIGEIDSVTFTIEGPGQLATLTTIAASAITSSSASVGGNISSNGGSPITQRGVVWSTSPNPTTANNSLTSGNGTGSYGINLTSLDPLTTYYARAFAVNSAGTAYGNEVSFSTIGTAIIDELFCNDAVASDTLREGVASNGVTITIPYLSTYGGTYGAQTIESVSGTGLTATLAAGSLVQGSGNLVLEISGTPTTEGYSGFELVIGYQMCYVQVYAAGSIFNLDLTYGSMTDQDGNDYATIVIGSQEWMAEDLHSSTYANGDPIPNVTDAAQWITLSTGAWVHYNNDPQYEELYGKLYNWYTVVDPRNVCPTGWHVPTLAEWNVLTDYLGGLSVAGGKMKSTAPEWEFPNGGATNESGFSAMPSGSRSASNNGDFVTHGFFSRYWSTTEDSPTGANGSEADYLFGSTGIGPFYKLDGNSVRCLRD